MSLRQPISLPRRPRMSFLSFRHPLFPLRLRQQPRHHPQTRPISSIQRHLRRPPTNTPYYSRPHITGLPAVWTGARGALERKLRADTLPLRTGAIATKKGMTGIYDPQTGVRQACTVLQLDRVEVVAVKTRQRHGYDAVVLGCGWRRPKRVGKAMLGVFEGARNVGLPEGAAPRPGISPKRHLGEFRVRDERGLLPPGTPVSAAWFQQGQFVDARAVTRGMGFAGGMKRHGFAGQPASHGNSLAHRAMGSAGPGQGGGSRVHPGKKMAGNMGGERHTVQNLEVLMVDDANGLVVIKGCVPGPRKCLVKISDAIKKPWPDVLPVAVSES